jgi:uncharacterized protein
MRAWMWKTLAAAAVAMLVAMTAVAEDAASRDSRLLAQAKSIIEQLVREDFAAISAQFSQKMRAAVSDETLRAGWVSLPPKIGKFQRQGEARMEHRDSAFSVVIACQFERATLDATIVFSADDEVIRLTLTPAKASMAKSETVDKYILPDYANADRYSESDLAVGSGEWLLPGTLTLPKGEGPFAAVVLVHGSGPHDRDESLGSNRPFRDLADGLASRGIAVLRYEKRSQQYPQKLMADYAHLTARQETEDDALAAVVSLRNVRQVDPKRIFVAGHSLGAMLAPRIGARDSQIAGLILLAAPARQLQDIVISQVRYIAELDGNVSDEEKAQIADLEKKRDELAGIEGGSTQTTGLMLNLPASYWLDLRGYQPAAFAANSNMPLLVLQGERDYQVTMTDFKLWQEISNQRSGVTTRSYPGLNHLFLSGSGPSSPKDYERAGQHVDIAVVDDIEKWIKR